MYNPAAHEQATNHNRRLMPDARVFGVLAATGALALGGGVGHANAAGESAAQPRSIDTALEQPMTQISTDMSQTPLAPGEKTKILSLKETVQWLQPRTGEDEVKKVTLKRKGTALKLDLAQDDKMAEVRIGSIYKERILPGFGGVDDGVVQEYSKVYPYLISPDFLSKKTVKVQAVTKAQKKGKWKVLSNTVTMPQFDNYDVIPMSSPQILNSTESASNPDMATRVVNGYKGNLADGYVKNHKSSGKLKLRRPLTPKERKNLYVRVVQKTTPAPGASKYSKVVVRDTATSVFGPFKSAKQSKSTPVEKY